ncbi:MAG: hypothetical protein SCALA702_05830 [Melioribacteraceae bacterium]|nr:MAG: hypothetical protein SCALA702_05830 [Melioribacteraceae bacterium]
MKKLILALSLFLAITINAQFTNPLPDQGFFGGGAGVTWIDGAPHYTIRLFPEIAFANIGVGLDLNLEFTSDGNLRTENFNEFSDYLSIIRYFRYGKKNDPVYARLGALDHATLGHGTIINRYNNSVSYDKRRVGLELDIDFGIFGFESVYSAFGEAGVIGMRGYLRPLQLTSLKDVPILGNLETGATIAMDTHEYADIAPDNTYVGADNGIYASNDTDYGNMTIWGFDLGLPIVRSKIVNMDLYYDFINIVDYGNGSAIGLQIAFKGLGLVDIYTKFERRINGDQYQPAYFNSLYEIDRFSIVDTTTGIIRSKAFDLYSSVSPGNGYFGELTVSIINTFNIIGSYQRLDDDPKSGILHLSTNIAPEEASFVARAGYDKVRIQDEKDLFTLDDRSYLYAELGYKPIPYVLVSMVYHWTFTPERDADDNILGYIPQKKIEPRVSFVYPFNM